jgi:hypothetical protein
MVERSMRATWALALVTVVGCFGNDTTHFPAGLEPLEDDTAPAQQAPYTEGLAMVDGDNGSYTWLHGRGYLRLPPAEVWATAKDPELMATVCSTDAHMVMLDTDPAYEEVFDVHYTVDQVITVEWDEQWRYGTVEGMVAMPMLAMIRYQKVFGSELIRLIEGSIEVLATDDPDVTEVQFIEHINAAGGGVADMRKSMQHRFDAIAAVARGDAVPACP